MPSIVVFVARTFQFIFSIVALGLSVSLYNWASGIEDRYRVDINGAKAKLGYSAFAGAWGLLVASVSQAEYFVPIPSLVLIALDGLAAIFFVAAGGVLAAAVGGVDCGRNYFKSACQRYEADTAFQFLGFIVSLALIGLVFWKSKKEGKPMTSAV